MTNQKAKALKSFALLELNKVYDVVRVESSNIVINLDGIEIGFSTQYLQLVVDEERLKELRDRESQIDAELSRLTQLKRRIGVQIREIEETLVNQIKMNI